jgi:hypothetical protein
LWLAMRAAAGIFWGFAEVQTGWDR